MTHAPTRTWHVAVSPWDHMDVSVHNRLASRLACVGSDVEAGDGGVFACNQ